jgi:hypothetical protein
VIEDRRLFLRAADSLPDLAVPGDFAAAVMARLDAQPASKRVPIFAWLVAAAAGCAAFGGTLVLLGLFTGQNLWEYLARIQHAFVGYLQAAATTAIRLVKYVLLFLKVSADFASALLETAKRAAAFITPEIQAACLVSAVLILAMAAVLWRRRSASLENPHEK